MFGLGFPELIIILIIILIVFGAKKLPELGGSIGKGIKNFQKALKGTEEKAVAHESKERKTKPIETR